MGPAERWRAFWPALLAIVVAGAALRVLYTLAEAPWPPSQLDDQFYFQRPAGSSSPTRARDKSKGTTCDLGPEVTVEGEPLVVALGDGATLGPPLLL